MFKVLLIEFKFESKFIFSFYSQSLSDYIFIVITLNRQFFHLITTINIFSLYLYFPLYFPFYFPLYFSLYFSLLIIKIMFLILIMMFFPFISYFLKLLVRFMLSFFLLFNFILNKVFWGSAINISLIFPLFLSYFF